MTDKYSNTELEALVAGLRQQLQEATDTIDAIRTGAIDAFVVNDGNGPQLYTLKSADQTYRVFIETMNESAITLNSEGLIVYCNTGFSEVMQMPLSKLIGAHFTDFIKTEQKSLFEEILSDAWDADDKGEIILVRNDGTQVPFLFSLTTLELDEGIALSIILTDLSLQKENERQLLQKNEELEAAKAFTDQLNDELEEKVKERTKELLVSREHFRFLADHIPVIAWTAQPDGQVSYFNKRWYEYTGMEQHPGSEKNWIDALHEDDVQHTLEAWNKALTTGETYQVEYRFKRAEDDTYRWHFGNAVPYRNEEGQIVSWFGISTDIDYQKKEMEKKDEFISMVSHELKTPVTSLKGFTQLLMAILKGNSEPVVSEYLGTMNNQINKLTRLISDLLDATRFNGGQLQFDVETFAFNKLATEICSEMQLTTNKHLIQLQLDKDVFIRGDRNRIGQVMINLISNAIKYSPSADRVLVHTKAENGRVDFCVKDFGIGISKLEQPKLYTRFFRAAENTHDNTFPGMGLGLYISMAIVAKHDGTMRVESELNQGSSFCFTLPVVDTE
ncbi:ATP-binding protein [Ferruginibacter sp. HRS2-29]|uniref:PAS domain-containing sensor histidine kinase n=1 Tax=Ferruginibacter sp. HRS2-29 TaxID=2487334 RepID=UPI0020CCE1BF|nr:ATP-binding protein [Ferruginibacter sp. HRS2-29]MCP9749886.1 PAS domain S-box protein [Ferruginibacter sp. HRS2-29]